MGVPPSTMVVRRSLVPWSCWLLFSLWLLLTLHTGRVAGSRVGSALEMGEITHAAEAMCTEMGYRRTKGAGTATATATSTGTSTEASGLQGATPTTTALLSSSPLLSSSALLNSPAAAAAAAAAAQETTPAPEATATASTASTAAPVSSTRPPALGLSPEERKKMLEQLYQQLAATPPGELPSPAVIQMFKYLGIKPEFRVGIAQYTPYAYEIHSEDRELGPIKSPTTLLEAEPGDVTEAQHGGPSASASVTTPTTPVKYKGFAVDVWEAVAASNGWRTLYIPGTYSELLQMLADDKIDTIADGLFLTRNVRQIHPQWMYSSTFWASGISILAKNGEGDINPSAVDTMLTLLPQLSKTLLIFLKGLLFFGVVFWLFERNPKVTSCFMANTKNEVESAEPVMEYQVNEVPSGAEGVLCGMWWAACTFTTVGYGDYFPKTAPGKVWGFLCMFSSLFFVAMFTGAISSSMILAGAGGPMGIDSLSDLDGRNVAVLQGSFPAHYMATQTQAILTEYTTMTAAVQAVLVGDVEAVAGVADVLNYHMTEGVGKGKTVKIGKNFHQHSLVFPFNSETKSPVMLLAGAGNPSAGGETSAAAIQRIVSETLLSLQSEENDERLSLDEIISMYME